MATPSVPTPDYWSLLFVFVLSTFIGVGVIRRVSRLLHTPLMSLTNAISAIAVVASIVIVGRDHPPVINPSLAACVCRQMRRNLRKLGLGQPEKVGNHWRFLSEARESQRRV